ncbi:hypothetical protein DRH14_05455, partial [Candidatus Shapirobacteria bacterium]
MLKKIENWFDDIFEAVKTVPPGVYQYQAPEDAPAPYKLHLRIEDDGSGILIINASTVLHLNRTAAEYAYHLVKGRTKEEITTIVTERYDINLQQAQEDLDEFLVKIDRLVHTEDLDPVAYLDVDRVTPYSKKISAPYRLDCAVTYRLRQADNEAAPTDRVSRELGIDEWKQVIRKAWDAGIPHINFTGGEPTLREDLPELIAEAEELGMVCGILTDGLAFTRKTFLRSLLQSGLDYIMMVADPDSKDFWKALRNVMSEDIAVTVHTTLTTDNKDQFTDLMEKLAKENVTSISMSAESEALSCPLEKASTKAAELGMTQVWDLPVPYSNLHPVALEL